MPVSALSRHACGGLRHPVRAVWQQARHRVRLLAAPAKCALSRCSNGSSPRNPTGGQSRWTRRSASSCASRPRRPRRPRKSARRVPTGAHRVHAATTTPRGARQPLVSTRTRSVLWRTRRRRRQATPGTAHTADDRDAPAVHGRRKHMVTGRGGCLEVRGAETPTTWTSPQSAILALTPARAATRDNAHPTLPACYPRSYATLDAEADGRT